MFLPNIHYIPSSISGGNEAAARYSKQLSKSNTKLTTLLSHYNAIVGVDVITIEDARKPDGIIYVRVPSINHLPYAVIWDAIRFRNTITRAEEEIHALEFEFTAIHGWYTDVHHKLVEALDRTPPTDRYEKGVRSAILSKLVTNELLQTVLCEDIFICRNIRIVQSREYSDSFPKEFLPRHIDPEEQEIEAEEQVRAEEREFGPVEEEELTHHSDDDLDSEDSD